MKGGAVHDDLLLAFLGVGRGELGVAWFLVGAADHFYFDFLKVNDSQVGCSQPQRLRL